MSMASWLHGFMASPTLFCRLQRLGRKSLWIEHGPQLNKEFIRFMNALERDILAGRIVYLVLNNVSSG